MYGTLSRHLITPLSRLLRDGKTYDDIWHVVRLVIQIALILIITWVGQVTPFKGREKLHDSLDIFKGRITSSGFESGDRIVVGAWKESIFGEFTDTLGLKWVSVFGTDHPEALVPAGTDIQDDTLSANVNGKGEVLCDNCPVAREKGADEWLELFSNEPLVSPFQDGHYIYVVIPGSGTGEDVKAPRICVADAESPLHLHKIMDL